jgi:hypothetical protein
MTLFQCSDAFNNGLALQRMESVGMPKAFAIVKEDGIMGRWQAVYVSMKTASQVAFGFYQAFSSAW